MKRHSNRKTSKKITRKERNILLIIFLIAIVPIAIVFAVAYSPFDLTVVRGNDLIKNFRVESYDGIMIPTGVAEGGKLITEYDADWSITEDSIKIIEEYIQDGYKFIKFSVRATNRFNFFTAVNLNDAASNLDVVKEDFNLGQWVHYDGVKSWAFQRKLTWSYSNFGNVRLHNQQNNIFSGAFKFSFDINDSPLPDFLTDADGNEFTKEFSYIGINGISVMDTTFGHLSDTIPSFVNIDPATYQSSESHQSLEEELEDNAVVDVFSYEWDPRVEYTNPVVTTQVGEGIISQSFGASLNPTTKLGAVIWTPETKDKSMTDCAFTYNIISLSPIVKEYSSTLTYYRQDIQTSMFMDVFTLPWVAYPIVDFAREYVVQTTRPVALQVVNRYIHVEIGIDFDVWSKFNITAAEVEDDTPLQPPEEWDEADIWGILPTDLDGGGTTTIGEGGVSDPLLFLIIIGLIVVGIIGMYIFFKVGLPVVLKSRYENKKKR